MINPKECGCKGIRRCLVCEDFKTVVYISDPQPAKEFVYCIECRKAFLRRNDGNSDCHPLLCSSETVEFSGIDILPEFVSEEEEQFLCTQINSAQWNPSQSGRLKQDYGPKVNFKKKKLNMDNFIGLPSYSRFLVDRFSSYDCLRGFVPVELCNLEYLPERGSSIDPHLDDSWLWGERLVTLNLLSDVFLTFNDDGHHSGVVVKVNLPRRSVVVVSGVARHVWKHAIWRDDVKARRVAMTFRELSPEFCVGGTNEETGSNLVKIASAFNAAR